MPHDVTLIATIAAAFVLAFAFGFIATRLRLPPLVGYLVAGVAIGPFTPGFVADSGLASQLAEIGVILLMFGVGLHFSIGDLMAVRRIALPGAVAQIATATVIGTVMVHFWGWSLGAGLVFGLSLSVASTVVLLRALEQRNAIHSPEGRIAIGWLIVEDLAMVLALVLLPALAESLGGGVGNVATHGVDGARAASHRADGASIDGMGAANQSVDGGGAAGQGADSARIDGMSAADQGAAVEGVDGTHPDVLQESSGKSLLLALGLTLGKVALFVALALVVGKRAVPWLLMKVARAGSRELFTLAVLAVALGIAFGSAELFGVSFALGAFFAGVILSESDLSHRAAADSLPLQDAFAVMFFVSVGMLFDPMILIREPLAVLAVLGVIMVGKSAAAFLIVLAFGYPLVTALTVSASLAQIGEFSFILAGLGVTLGLLPSEGRDLILAGALLSITLNPLAFSGINWIMKWLHKSPRLLKRVDRSSNPELVAPVESGDLADHAVLVGYGRVGGPIGPALSSHGFPFVVIERDRHLLDRLQEQGIPVVFGDASAPGVLAAAGIAKARLLVIATPDGFQSRRILEIARAANPSISTIMRTHSQEELEYLESQHVDYVVMGERELAMSMLEHALRSLGVPKELARLTVKQSRGDRVNAEGT